MEYFTIANNELSQDYFFQWLFLNINRKEKYNEKVCNCAKKIIKLLTGFDVDDGYEVECYTQASLKNVRFDIILILIKDKFRNVFIIEDKVNYVINNNFDLYKETYMNSTIKNYNLTTEEKEKTKWLCIKIGNIKKEDLENTRKYNVQLFRKEELKPIFEEFYTSGNEIFDDFVASKFRNDFMVKEISKWNEEDHKLFINNFIKKAEFIETKFLVEKEFSNRTIIFKNSNFLIEFDFSYNNKCNIKVKLKYNDINNKFDFTKTIYFRNYSKGGFQGIDRPEYRKKHKMYSEREEHILIYLNELNKFCN